MKSLFVRTRPQLPAFHLFSSATPGFVETFLVSCTFCNTQKTPCFVSRPKSAIIRWVMCVGACVCRGAWALSGPHNGTQYGLVFHIKLYLSFTAGWQNWLCLWKWQVVLWCAGDGDRNKHLRGDGACQWLSGFHMQLGLALPLEFCSICMRGAWHPQVASLIGLPCPRLGRQPRLAPFAGLMGDRWRAVDFNKPPRSVSGINGPPSFLGVIKLQL